MYVANQINIKRMKEMTCRQMGGSCDEVIKGKTPQEMIDNGMKHLEKAHPQMVADMKNMPKEEGDKWNKEFMDKWASTPEV